MCHGIASNPSQLNDQPVPHLHDDKPRVLYLSSEETPYSLGKFLNRLLLLWDLVMATSDMQSQHPTTINEGEAAVLVWLNVIAGTITHSPDPWLWEDGDDDFLATRKRQAWWNVPSNTHWRLAKMALHSRFEKSNKQSKIVRLRNETPESRIAIIAWIIVAGYLPNLRVEYDFERVSLLAIWNKICSPMIPSGQSPIGNGHDDLDTMLSGFTERWLNIVCKVHAPEEILLFCRLLMDCPVCYERTGYALEVLNVLPKFPDFSLFGPHGLLPSLTGRKIWPMIVWTVYRMVTIDKSFQEFFNLSRQEEYYELWNWDDEDEVWLLEHSSFSVELERTASQSQKGVNVRRLVADLTLEQWEMLERTTFSSPRRNRGMIEHDLRIRIGALVDILVDYTPGHYDGYRLLQSHEHRLDIAEMLGNLDFFKSIEGRNDLDHLVHYLGYDGVALQRVQTATINPLAGKQPMKEGINLLQYDWDHNLDSQNDDLYLILDELEIYDMPFSPGSHSPTAERFQANDVPIVEEDSFEAGDGIEDDEVMVSQDAWLRRLRVVNAETHALVFQKEYLGILDAFECARWVRRAMVPLQSLIWTFMFLLSNNYVHIANRMRVMLDAWATWDPSQVMENYRSIRNSVWTLLRSAERASAPFPIDEEELVQMFRLDIETMSIHFIHTLRDETLYNLLLMENQDRIQWIINAIQDVVDYPLHDPSFKPTMAEALVKLSQVYGQYPSQFQLSGLERLGSHAITAGGYGEIWQGSIKDRVVCMEGFQGVQHTWRRSHSKECCCRGHYLVFNLSSEYLTILWTFLKKEPNADRSFLISDIVFGIDHLHSMKIVHGDLKADNILVTPRPQWRACITDFGLSSIKGTDSALAQVLTLSRDVPGTTRWQAPELFTGKPPSFASDIYAFASVCLELFTCKRPFAEVRLDSAVMLQVLRGVRPRRPDIDTGLNDSLWKLMGRCWHGEPVKRPTSKGLVHQVAIRQRTEALKETCWEELFPSFSRSSHLDPLMLSMEQIRARLA
ncbi:hypothetical protein AMATHDRAFT_6095 [Amanita thiersii Skay4041]|uniref:Protein kinase domain-containing protein n=1 Tax=Amanita thiersii Skay4041 TaxID=703135 RepID=A0A2A9NIM8_9AGAR|nr:hypothetical protein AMATHDRAFT_6095 [Amanita thiersii Skay4041]